MIFEVLVSEYAMRSKSFVILRSVVCYSCICRGLAQGQTFYGENSALAMEILWGKI